MRTESFHADDLAKALRRCKIATMPELKRALGTEVDVTVFRKLKQLAYRTSYSHRGSYYTLDETAHFDRNGLWSFQSVWFSRQGTLLDTAQAFVENSSAGYFAEELDHALHVGTKEPLLRLVQHERVARESVKGLYLYCSINPVLRERQLLARHVLQAEQTTSYRPGELRRFWPRIIEPHGRVHFAGAYCDNLNWGQEAATRSAYRVAEAIHKA